MKLNNLVMIGMMVMLSINTSLAQTIVGAGATFPNPLYQKWAILAKQVGIELNYQSVGSGAGQNQIKNRTVDFGASDAPLRSDDLVKNNLLQFPTSIGSLVIVVNIPGINKDQLKLTGVLIADIYLGKIRRWNDQAIQSINPGLQLPNLLISPIYRADGSGTTYIYTSYLKSISQEWNEKVGSATSVKWPVGSGAKGNDGVSASVKHLTGSISYVEFAYAKIGNLITTQLQNKDGYFVTATASSFKAAADNADWNVPGFALNIINQPGSETWPIVSPTFVLLPKDSKNPVATQNVIKFFDWAFVHGDAAAVELDYVPLPATVKNMIKQSWADIVR
jgi:phosphate transport system substrate-binding protein